MISSKVSIFTSTSFWQLRDMYRAVNRLFHMNRRAFSQFRLHIKLIHILIELVERELDPQNYLND